MTRKLTSLLSELVSQQSLETGRPDLALSGLLVHDQG
jgi:hypothetical protein